MKRQRKTVIRAKKPRIKAEGLVKHRILVHMGKPERASCDVPPADRHPSADRNPSQKANGEIKLFPGKEREKL